jgi:hypothetical protein
MPAALPSPSHPSTERPGSSSHLPWEEVSQYQQQFSRPQELEHTRQRRQSVSRPNRPFLLNTPRMLLAIGVLELVALLSLNAHLLTSSRQSSQLDGNIAAVNEKIARIDRQISTLNASPHLSQWADQLGYRPATPTDFDDVTKDSALPAASDLAVPAQ